MVGMMRIELTTFCPPDKRANQAALHPDLMLSNILVFCQMSSQISKKIHFFYNHGKKWPGVLSPGRGKNQERGEREFS